MPISRTPEQPSGKHNPAPPDKKGERKPWKKKSPVEVVLEQADKLKEEIAEGEKELDAKRQQLKKFEEACKIFQA